MRTMDFKKKLCLTEEQKAVLKELDEAFAKAEKAGIEIFYDSNCFTFTAVNTLEVETIGAADDEPEDAVNVEPFMPWDNVHPNISVYDSFFERIYAKFKESTDD